MTLPSGDLVFYGSRGSLIDRLITWRTRPGRFVHVGIALSDGTMVDATQAGVTRHKLLAPDAVFPLDRAPGLSIERVNEGLAWLQGQVGDAYGYLDDLADALPSWWRVVLTDTRAYSCSHLCAQFLIECGLAGMLGEMAATPQRVTPNSLARACGLIK